VLQRVLGIILPVFTIILLGYIYALRQKPDMTWVNRINVNVLAPALIFTALASKDFDLATHAVLILGAIGVVAGSGLLAWPFVKLLYEPTHVRAADDVQQLRQHGAADRRVSLKFP
jgi:malate permease and related proteins